MYRDFGGVIKQAGSTAAGICCRDIAVRPSRSLMAKGACAQFALTVVPVIERQKFLASVMLTQSRPAPEPHLFEQVTLVQDADQPLSRSDRDAPSPAALPHQPEGETTAAVRPHPRPRLPDHLPYPEAED